MVKTKILAMILAVAMIVAIVPTFGLVAGAAETSVDSVVYGAPVAWSAPDDVNGNVDDVWDGWTAVAGNNSTVVNVSGSTLRFYHTERSGSAAIASTVTSPGYAADATDAVIVAWEWDTANGNDLYMNITLKDTEGTEITTFTVDKNHAEYPLGLPQSNGTKVAVMARNNDDETHDVFFYINGKLNEGATKTNVDGTIKGFGSIETSDGPWTTENTAVVGLKNLTVASSSNVVDVEATYKAGEAELETVSGAYDADYADGYPVDEKYYAADGSSSVYYAEAKTLTVDDDEILMEAIDNVDVAGITNGGKVYADGKIYDVVSDNVIPNGDFSNGLLGWFDGSNSGEKAVTATENNFTINGNGTITAKGHTGNTGVASLYRSWPIENGKTYVFTYYDNVSNSYHVLSMANELGEEKAADKGIIGTDMANASGSNKPSTNATADTQNFFVFTNDSDYKYAKIRFRWNNSSNTFGNFGLYEVELAEDQTLPDAVEEIEAVTVIDGNDPFLPKTVKLTADGEDYGVGTVTEWVAGEKSEEGVITYTGTVDTGIAGHKLTAKANVTVLDCTDDTLVAPINNVNASGGSLAAAHTLKYPVKSKASFEFDVVYHVAVGSDDLSALGSAELSDGKPSFGSEAFAMQGSASKAGNVGFRKNPNGWSSEFKTETEKTYRVLTTIDLDAGTYDVTVRDESGVVFSDTGLTYRKAETKVIDTLYIIYNKSDNKARTTVSNFRVSWDGTSEYFRDVTIEYKAEDGTVIHKIEGVYEIGDQITYEAGKAYYDGKIYSYDAVDKEVTEDIDATITVDATVEIEYAATAMEQERGGNLNLGGYPYGIAGTSNADVSTKDADGVDLFNGAVSNFGTERRTNISFIKPEAEDSQLIMLYLPVGVFKQNSTGIGDGEARLIAKVGEKETYSVNVLNDTSAKNETVYDEPVVLEFDVTDIIADVEAGNEVTIRIETAKGGAGFVDLDMAAFGGSKAGIAPYLAAVDGVEVTVEEAADDALITKNGSKVEDNPFYAVAGDTVRVYKGATVEDGLAMTVVNGGTNAAATATVLGEATTITVVVAPTAAPEVTLGWTGDAFAFLVKPGEDATAIVAYVEGEEVATAELGDSDAALITTDETNAIFTFAGKIESAGEIGEQYSIYSLVATALSTWTKGDTIKEEQLEAVNTVINAGGLYIKGDDLTPEAKMIFTYTAAEGEGTIALNEKLTDSNIKLEGIKYAVGEGEAKDATVAKDGKSATIELPAGTADDMEVVIYLEEVEFTFETADESAADEVVSGELDFVEEV